MVDRREQPGLTSTMQDAIRVSDGLIRVRDAWSIWSERNYTDLLLRMSFDIVGMKKKLDNEGTISLVGASIVDVLAGALAQEIDGWLGQLSASERQAMTIANAQSRFAAYEGAAIAMNNAIILSNTRTRKSPLSFRR